MRSLLCNRETLVATIICSSFQIKVFFSFIQATNEGGVVLPIRVVAVEVVVDHRFLNMAFIDRLSLCEMMASLLFLLTFLMT